MKKFETSYEAAKFYARENGEFDRLQENITEYINGLVEAGELTFVHDEGYKGSVAWCIEDPSAWYGYCDGEEVAGPRDTKSSIMKVMGDESAKRLDTGVYRGISSEAIIARLSDYREWNESCSSNSAD